MRRRRVKARRLKSDGRRERPEGASAAKGDGTEPGPWGLLQQRAWNRLPCPLPTSGLGWQQPGIQQRGSPQACCPVRDLAGPPKSPRCGWRGAGEVSRCRCRSSTCPLSAPGQPGGRIEIANFTSIKRGAPHWMVPNPAGVPAECGRLTGCMSNGCPPVSCRLFVVSKGLPPRRTSCAWAPGEQPLRGRDASRGGRGPSLQPQL
ncbi:hypothetical protein B0T22DRAFT_249174 [Podospora appendiculata]|uniref:Uncharacterized protein n=1 Tax=Podospora appendiculata TaxID=314037 RepID=A0AAE0X2F0_9PEZI|nr:hypothetical protein B0T22DRAFT_249174 [Podospora appendiculata]